MNKQIVYIVYAHLILFALGSTFLFIKKMPVVFKEQNTEIGCGTESPESNLNFTAKAQLGKTLFMSKCASCHNLFKDATGPTLIGFEDRGPWAKRENLYRWIKNPAEFMKTDSYTRTLKEKYGAMMTAFPDITNEEVDNIAEYINSYKEGSGY